MLLSCSNKGCFDQNEHLLDQQTNEVMCLKCNRPIPYPQTTKKTLASLGQVMRHVKKALEFECKGCGKTSRPLVRPVGRTSIAVCRHCGERFNISAPFVEALKMVKEELADEEQGRSVVKRAGTKPVARKNDPVPPLPAKSRQAGAGVPKKSKKTKG